MGYQLGIDLGTTFTAAALHRDGKVEVVVLGSRAAAVPSVLFMKEDETVLTGETAGRRGLTEPGRMAKEFKRRVGDSAPIILGGAPYAADALMARLLRWVVDAVSETEGGPPDHVTVCHPANWGPYKRELLDQAIRQANLEATTTITEPEAAAAYYASAERVEPGSVVAVYDLGGGTFDAAVLRKLDDGWEILGEPEGIERLGGIDFDEAIFQHVRAALGGKLEELDASDPNALAALNRLREDSTSAKEALSSDTDTGIPVMLPNASTEVRLTRAEFEAMVRPMLLETVEAMRRALRSAGVEPDQIDRVLLVGGSSRIPSVAQTVGAELGRPVAVDAHPKHAIALGAALAAARSAGVAEGAVTVDAGGGASLVQFQPSAATGAASGNRGRRRTLVIAAAVVAVLAAGGGALAAFGGGGGGEQATKTTSKASASATGETIATAPPAADTMCDLLTEAEAEAPLGTDLSTTTDDDETCLYETPDHLTYVSLSLQPGAGFMNEAQMRTIMRSFPGGADAEEIAGVGDLALFLIADFSKGFGGGAGGFPRGRVAQFSSGNVEYFLMLLANKTVVDVSLAGAADAESAKTALTQYGQTVASRL